MCWTHGDIIAEKKPASFESDSTTLLFQKKRTSVFQLEESYIQLEKILF